MIFSDVKIWPSSFQHEPTQDSDAVDSGCGTGVHRLALDHKQLGQQPYLPQCGQHSVRQLLPRAVRRGARCRRLYGAHLRVTKGPSAAEHQVPPPPPPCTTPAPVTYGDGFQASCPRVQPAGRAYPADAGILRGQVAAAGTDGAERSEPALRRRRGTCAQPNDEASVSPAPPCRRLVPRHLGPTHHARKRCRDRWRRRRLRRPLRSLRELLSLLLTGPVHCRYLDRNLSDNCR